MIRNTRKLQLYQSIHQQEFFPPEKKSLDRYVGIHLGVATGGDPDKLRYQSGPDHRKEHQGKDGNVLPDTCQQIDDHIKNKRPDIYEKYLKRFEYDGYK